MKLGEPLRIEPLASDVPTVEERAFERLRYLIATERLPEGQRLRHRELAEQLRISPTPVRNSLIQLERDGLVTLGANGRAYTSRLNREHLEELYATRLGLEGLAARLGAEAVGESDVEEMRRQLAKLRAFADRGDIEPFLRTRWDYHVACYRPISRPRLIERVERLYFASERYNRRLLNRAGGFDTSYGHYRALLDAAERRDGAAAERALHDGVWWAIDTLSPELPSEADEPGR